VSRFAESIRDPFALQKLEMTQTNLPILLRYEDKNSMRHSIEARLPFLDYRLVEFCLSLPSHAKINNGWTKWLLRNAMKGRMDDEIVTRSSGARTSLASRHPTRYGLTNMPITLVRPFYLQP
jgi:asparagine synthase (glutamine-hydrolysing)